MHDVEERITAWRRATAKLLPGQPEIVQELEDHLREQIEVSLRAGLTSADACAQAIERLGDPRATAAEFGRLSDGRLTAWWPARLVFWGLPLFFVPFLALLCWRYLSGSLEFLLVVHVFLVSLGYVATFASGGLGICCLCTQFLRPLTGRERRAWSRSLFLLTLVAGSTVLVGLVLGAIWTKVHWGRYWAWDPKETGAVLVLVWTGTLAIAQAKFSRGRSERVVPMLAVLGNAVTAVAWFGAHAVATGAALPALFPSLVISQVLLAMLGFFPTGVAARWTFRR
jgi:hypothetical protein